MRTVEQCYLTLVVWSLRLSNKYVETCLICREFLAQLLACHVLCLFDNPEVEDFSLNNEVVAIANLLLNLSNLIAWEARNDTVNESSAYIVVLLEPLRESSSLLAEVFFPKLDVLTDAILEVMAVEEDKLTRHDDESLGRIAIESVETIPEKLCELTWI